MEILKSVNNRKEEQNIDKEAEDEECAKQTSKAANDSEEKTGEAPLCSSVPDNVDDEDDYDEDCNEFHLWLRSISQCLSNKISDDPVVIPNHEEEEEEEEYGDEDERCMQVVKSVFDEETATEVIKSYLTLLRDQQLPEQSKLQFRHCQFDQTSGVQC